MDGAGKQIQAVRDYFLHLKYSAKTHSGDKHFYLFLQFTDLEIILFDYIILLREIVLSVFVAHA